MHDENTLPTQPIAAKSIHQRNKSTPALPTLLQGGAVRGGQKRAAFADVSNTQRIVQPAKDDSAIIGKASYDAIKPVIHVQEPLKVTALSRPAQRPLPIKATSTQAVTATTSTIIPTKPAAAETAQPHIQPAETRRVYNKKSAAVLRDNTENQQQAISVITSLHPSEEENSASAEAILAQLKESAEEQSPAIDGVILPYVESKRSDSANAHVPASIQPVPSVEVHNDLDLAPISLEERQVLLALQQTYQIQEQQPQQPLANVQPSQQPLAHPYYDDEEDDEELYYDETTARSLKMRGDNTTGGATIVLAPRPTAKNKAEIAAAKELVDNSRTNDDIEDEQWDTSMVAEYGEEIFDYMRVLEDRMRPNPHYMDHQTECQWSMRAVLMDWLVQVHQRFTLLPETLFLSVNYIDRFLSCKIVSLAKLQLVGATAIFLASKYEEVNCPSIQEIVYMVDNGYTQDEILKAERFMLSMLAFELGWPGPMSFLRRISKADDYDLETRTLAKYFLEVTIMDERFVGCTPSFTAAGAHCLARLMLRKGDWTPAHVYYSNYTYSQLRHLLAVMVECCEDPLKHHAAVFDKYQDKRYKRASHFVQTEMRNGFSLPKSRGSSAGFGDVDMWKRGN